MIQTVGGKYPVKPRSAYVHPSAAVIGDVKLGNESSVWPGAIIRGDAAEIIIGEQTSVQDCCVLHTGKLKMTVGNRVTVGHGAVLHSCDIGDGTLIGAGAVILDAVKIGENCVIEAGAVIPGGKAIPSGSVVSGNPFQIIRQTTPGDTANNDKICGENIELARSYIRTGNIL